MELGRFLIILSFIIIISGIFIISALMGYVGAEGWGGDDNGRYCLFITWNTHTNNTQQVIMPCLKNA